MEIWKTLFVIILIKLDFIKCARNIIFPIGGLFNGETLVYSKKAFEKIASASSSGTSEAYKGRVIYPSVRDTYSTALEVCHETSGGHSVVALVDARPTKGICDTVCLLCNRLNISHLSLGWQEPATLPEDQFTFSYYPPSNQVSKAYATLIQDLGWDRFSILYEDDNSFARLQEVIASWPHKKKEPITYRRLVPGKDNRQTFKYIFKVARLSHHIIDCAVDNIIQYMKEIVQVENSTQYQSFLLTNLDAHTVNLEGVPNMVANMSTFYMTTSDPTRWKDIGIDPGLGIRVRIF